MYCNHEERQNIRFALKRLLHNIDINAFSSDLDGLNTTLIAYDIRDVYVIFCVEND